MKIAIRLALVAATLAALTVPARAHHGTRAMFDVTRRITLTGSVTRVEWMNPHPYVSIDVKDAAGSVQNWVIELASPGILRQAGLTPGSLKTGAVVTVEAFGAKDGTPVAFASSLRIGR